MKPHTGGRTSSLCNSVYEISDKLDALIDETAETGTERAIRWCVGSDEYIPEDESQEFNKPYETEYIRDVYNIQKPITGDVHSVTTGRTLKCDDEFGNALFHTHPRGSGEYSNRDYATTAESITSLECLGFHKDGENIINCDAIVRNDKHKERADDIIRVYRTECAESDKEYIRSIENNEPQKELSQKYDNYLDGRNNMLDAVSDAIEDGVISRCSMSSNILEHPTIHTRERKTINIKRRYDNPNDSTLDYTDEETGKNIGYISYGVHYKYQTDKKGKRYRENCGTIHSTKFEFDNEYDAEEILTKSMDRVLCDLKCKGAKKNVYVIYPKYIDAFKKLGFKTSESGSKEMRKRFGTLEIDITDIECSCTAGVKDITKSIKIK